VGIDEMELELDTDETGAITERRVVDELTEARELIVET
jgi:hypothetical protein